MPPACHKIDNKEKSKYDKIIASKASLHLIVELLYPIKQCKFKPSRIIVSSVVAFCPFSVG